MEIKGIIHVHTMYSHDGELSLSDLAQLCKTSGYKFVIVTEHAEDMTEDSMSEFVHECKLLSDEDLVIIPGLEFICNGLHILGLGIEKLLQMSDFRTLVNEIHKQGGIAVLAHVSYYKDIPLENLLEVDGIEVWNSRYDGRYAPKLKCIKTFENLKKHNSNVVGYCGLDLHSYYEFGKLSIIVNINEEVDGGVILDALRKGDFKITNGIITLEQDLNVYKKMILILLRMIYICILILKKSIAKIFRATGIKPPKSFLRLIKRML